MMKMIVLVNLLIVLMDLVILLIKLKVLMNWLMSSIFLGVSIDENESSGESVDRAD